MDDTDRRLIALLRENAGCRWQPWPISSKSRAVRCRNRIDRLTADGVIGGFTVRLKPEAEPQRVRAITMVAVDGEHATAVVKALRGLPEVHALHTTNGRWDIVVELGVDSLEAFDQALQRHPTDQGDFEFRDEFAVIDAQDMTRRQETTNCCCLLESHRTGR